MMKPMSGPTAGHRRQCIRVTRRLALLRARAAAAKHGRTPRARVVGMATAVFAPRIMRLARAAPRRAGVDQRRSPSGCDELNERCRAGSPCCAIGLKDDDERVNPMAAQALGHPLGASGARW